MAKKPVTINEIMHPLGVGASAIPMRQFESDLMSRFYKVILPNIPSIKVMKRKEDYVLLIRIPSERNHRAVKPVFYDVIFEFYPRNADNRSSMYVNEYGVRIFSNSPSYMFTFTYVYNERGLLPTFVPKRYYMEECLTKEPEIRNPIELLGVEKTIWYSIKFLERNQLLQKSRLNAIASTQRTTVVEILGEVSTHEAKLEERQGQKLKKKKKKTSFAVGKDDKPTGPSVDLDSKVLTAPENLAKLKTGALKADPLRKTETMGKDKKVGVFKSDLKSPSKMKTIGLQKSMKTNPFKKK